MSDEHACNYPTEIADVKQQRKIRWLLYILALGSIGGAFIFTVSVSQGAGALANEVQTIASDQIEDRQEIRTMRVELLRLERTNASEHQQVMESLGRIEERVSGCGSRLESLEARRVSPRDRRR